MELIKTTKSLSPLTNKEIDAKIYRENNNVYMIKEDESGKIYKTIIEKDYKFYKYFTKWKVLKELDPISVVFDISNKCNINCKFCYESERKRKEITLEEIKNKVKTLKSKAIHLAGCEPTMREDIDDIISELKKITDVSILTNGIKTADLNYLKKIKDAGLTKCTIQFFGFDDEIYLKLTSKKLLKEKLNSLINCGKLNIPTCLSVNIAKGVNDHEIKKIFDFAVSNSFIHDLRIRTVAPIGNHIDIDQYYSSELFSILIKSTNLNVDYIYNELNFMWEIAKEFNINFLYPKLCSFAFHINRKKDGKYNLIGEKLHGIDFDKIKFKKIKLLLLGIKVYGFMYLFNFLLKKIFNKISVKNAISNKLLRISIRAWPNIYTIDLEENKKCTTAYQKNNSIMKFCLRNIIDNNSLKKSHKK